jgi:hypothetical protein
MGRRKTRGPRKGSAKPEGRDRRGEGGRWREGAWALGLTLLAWLHRLAFLRSNRDWDWPYTIFYEGDSEAFYHYARAILGGRLYDNGLPFHPPGFPYFLAAVHALTGAGPDAAQVPHFAVKAAMALLGSLPVGLLYLVVKPYVGRLVALTASLLCLYHFGLYVLAVAPVSESLYLTLLLLAILLWSRRLAHPLAAPGGDPGSGWGAALGLGLLLGALALTRAEGALVAIVLVGVGLAGQLRRRPSSLRPWALVLAGWVLAVAPWTVRNAVRISEFNERQAGRLAEPLPTFVPLTLYGPINLALANNPQADGTFSRDFLASQSHSPTLDLADPEHLRFFLHGNELAWGWIRDHPGDFLRLLGRKWTLSFEAWRLGWTQWDWPGGLTGTRRPVDVFVPDSSAALALGPPLALLGLLACLGAPGGPRRWAVLVLLLTAAGLVTTGLFFGYVRQGLLLFPFWATLVAAGFVWLVRRLARPRTSWTEALPFGLEPSRRLLQILGGAALLVLVLEARGATTDRNYRATGTTLPGQRFLDRDQPMVLEVLPD